MPLTELWLSQVSTSGAARPKSYASPTSRQAPLAFGVKMTAYSAGSAWKKSSTARRADSTSEPAATLVGFSEWGLLYRPASNRSWWARTCAWAATPAPA